MYGVPKYNEIDPSLFVAITYIIIFGIMFADVGQGICLTVVGILMYKIKKMAIGKILAPCGISSAFFGLVLSICSTPCTKLSSDLKKSLLR